MWLVGLDLFGSDGLGNESSVFVSFLAASHINTWGKGLKHTLFCISSLQTHLQQTHLYAHQRSHGWTHLSAVVQLQPSDNMWNQRETDWFVLMWIWFTSWDHYRWCPSRKTPMSPLRGERIITVQNLPENLPVFKFLQRGSDQWRCSAVPWVSCRQELLLDGSAQWRQSDHINHNWCGLKTGFNMQPDWIHCIVILPVYSPWSIMGTVVLELSHLSSSWFKVVSEKHFTSHLL